MSYVTLLLGDYIFNRINQAMDLGGSAWAWYPSSFGDPPNLQCVCVCSEHGVGGWAKVHFGSTQATSAAGQAETTSIVYKWCAVSQPVIDPRTVSEGMAYSNDKPQVYPKFFSLCLTKPPKKSAWFSIRLARDARRLCKIKRCFFERWKREGSSVRKDNGNKAMLNVYLLLSQIHLKVSRWTPWTTVKGR